MVTTDDAICVSVREYGGGAHGRRIGKGEIVMGNGGRDWNCFRDGELTGQEGIVGAQCR